LKNGALPVYGWKISMKTMKAYGFKKGDANRIGGSKGKKIRTKGLRKSAAGKKSERRKPKIMGFRGLRQRPAGNKKKSRNREGVRNSVGGS